MKKTKLITAGVIATLIATNGYTYHSYIQDTNTYKKEIAENIKINYNLEKRNDGLSKNVDDLQGELNTSITENKKLSSDLKESKNKLNKANSEIKKQESQINSLKEELQTTKEQLQKESPRISSNSSGREMNVTVTAYQAFCTEGCTGKTRTGYDVSNTVYYQGYQIIATDPSVIPLYSIVEIKLNNGRVIKAISLDTGGAIKNSTVDFLVASENEAIQFGRQSGKLTVIREGRG